MKILAIDTSTSFAAIAVSIGTSITAESLFLADKCLSARLVPEIDKMLVISGISIEKIDIFAAATGPGSFTGVRAGIATAQGLALATGKACAGFSSLSAIAMNFSLASHPVCSMLDARKSEIYAGLFDCSALIPKPIISDTVLPPENFLELIRTTTDQPVIFAGDGAVRYRDLIISLMGEKAIFAPFTHNAGRAASGAMLALEAVQKEELLAPHQLLPVYLRASEAEYAKLAQQKKAVQLLKNINI